MKFNDLPFKIEKTQKILLAAIGLSFVFSGLLYLASAPGKRYTFRFQSVDSGRNNVEWRFLPRRKRAQRAALYIDELLLGPKTERSKPIFSPGTKATFCFERGRTLYVNLTSDLLVQSGNASEIMQGLEIFKMNIKRTFPKYKQVEIYIDKRGILQF